VNEAASAAAEKKKAAATRHDELFDLKQHPSETKDLWEPHKDRTAAMKQVLNNRVTVASRGRARGSNPNQSPQNNS
jgi:hypothetical protein